MWWEFTSSVNFGNLNGSLSSSTGPKSYVRVKLGQNGVSNFCSPGLKFASSVKEELKNSVLKIKS